MHRTVSITGTMLHYIIKLKFNFRKQKYKSRFKTKRKNRTRAILQIPSTIDVVQLSLGIIQLKCLFLCMYLSNHNVVCMHHIDNKLNIYCYKIKDHCYNI